MSEMLIIRISEHPENLTNKQEGFLDDECVLPECCKIKIKVNCLIAKMSLDYDSTERNWDRAYCHLYTAKEEFFTLWQWRKAAHIPNRLLRNYIKKLRELESESKSMMFVEDTI